MRPKPGRRTNCEKANKQCFPSISSVACNNANYSLEALSPESSRSSDQAEHGKFRKIKLKLSPAVAKREGKLVVLTRLGYYARLSDNKGVETKK